MTAPPRGLRFVRDPDLSRVSRLMQASWAEPCWVYDEPLLSYHLRRPSVDPNLLLGLEDETSRDLVAYYALMPLPLRVGGEDQRAVFGSFLTAAPAVRRSGAARAVQVRLLEETISKGYEQYLAFCEVGAASNESIVRSCSSLGLTTRTVATLSYLALPASAVAKRVKPASGAIRPYASGDGEGAAGLPELRSRAPVEAPHERADLDHRFGAPVSRTYVLPDADRLAALAHFVVLDVRDGGRQFRSAYLRDFEAGTLTGGEQEQFLSDALRAVVNEGNAYLVVAPACASAPVGLLMALGFRPTHRNLNLLATNLRPGSELPASGPNAHFRLDVF